MNETNKRIIFIVCVALLAIGIFLYWQYSSGEENAIQDESVASRTSLSDTDLLTVDHTIGEVIHHPAFEGFGELLMPRPNSIDESMRFDRVAELMPYHSHVSPENSIEAVNRMIEDTIDGETIFYPFYSEEERADDPAKEDTGLFYLRGQEGAPYAIIAPGGGFSYVGSFHEGFPYAVELNERGFNAFVIKYRIGGEQVATEDLAQAISFIQRHSSELNVSEDHYSLWGSSAGARMAAWIGTDGVSSFGGENIEKPATVVTAYTGHRDFSADDVSTFAVVSRDDRIASYEVMVQRIENLQQNNIPAEILLFDNVGHGFGVGIGTEAEGWIEEAISFWEDQIQ